MTKVKQQSTPVKAKKSSKEVHTPVNLLSAVRLATTTASAQKGKKIAIFNHIIYRGTSVCATVINCYNWLTYLNGRDPSSNIKIDGTLHCVI